MTLHSRWRKRRRGTAFSFVNIEVILHPTQHLCLSGPLGSERRNVFFYDLLDELLDIFRHVALRNLL